MGTAREAQGFVGPDAPTPEGIGSCVHCGFCLPVCPTYRETRNETSSPRGRIYLMRAISEGRLPLTGGFADEMFFCLACRACETACPAGVRYGDLVERSRAEIRSGLPEPLAVRLLQRLILRDLVPHPRRLAWMARAVQLYQRTGIGGWLGRAGLLDRFPRLRAAEALTPRIEAGAVGGAVPGTYPRRGEGGRRVAFFRGCVMDVVYGGTNRRTLDLLRSNGCEVVVPRDQTCCGALHLHAGLRREAKDLARRNIRAFLRTGAEAIIVNAAGCGATLREYAGLLGAEGGREAEAFASRVRDISEYLAALPSRKPFPSLQATAVYQDACHLAHGQGIRSAPRALLAEVPGLEIRPLPESDSCCGSAGIYNITHPESSIEILDRKMELIAEVDPDLVISGNPGCSIQLGFGVRRRGLRARVMHTVDTLSGGQGPGEGG